MPTEHTVDSGEGYFKSDFLMVMLRLFLDPARIQAFPSFPNGPQYAWKLYTKFVMFKT